MGTGNKAMRSAKWSDLPFAGITLFRFNGFYLSLLQHPEDRTKLMCIIHLSNCNFKQLLSFYLKIHLFI
jgi:hypothetical protein